MSAPRSIPVYFPEFGELVVGSIFAGAISERQQMNMDCSTYHPNGIVEQIWSTGDTVTFQLNGVSTSSFRVNINGDLYTGSATGVSGAPSSTLNWSIPMASYSNKEIRMVLEINTGVSWATYATSPIMKVLPPTDCIILQSRKFEYWGGGFTQGVWYDTNLTTPSFKQTLRVPASNRFASIDDIDYVEQLRSDGSRYACFSQVDEVREISTAPIPLWMHRVINYITRHDRFTIDGIRYVKGTDFRKDRAISGTNLYTGDMQVKLADHLYSMSVAN